MKKILVSLLTCTALGAAFYCALKKSNFVGKNLVYYEESWYEEGKHKTFLVFMDNGKISNSTEEMSFVKRIKFYKYISKKWKKAANITGRENEKTKTYAIAKFTNGEIYSYPVDSMFFGHYNIPL